jgi:hypothetical protein
MEYKPSDIFVGLVDFFAILLPGALLAFLLKVPADRHVFNDITLHKVGPRAESWVVFAFAAYLLGQFTFLVGATFMDSIYDRTYLRYMRRNGDALYEKAKVLAGDDGKIAGVLKWAGAYVRLSSPNAALEIERFEATSKFFRSLFVVLLVYAGTFAFHSQWPALAATLVLLALSFWRFCNQRWKFTEFSYLYFIELIAYRETSARR